MEDSTSPQSLYDKKIEAINKTEAEIIASMKNAHNKAHTAIEEKKYNLGYILITIASLLIATSIIGTFLDIELEIKILLFIFILIMIALLFFAAKIAQKATNEVREYKQQLYSASFRCLDKLQEKKIKVLEELEKTLESKEESKETPKATEKAN